jgi:hypothetical protein
LGSCLSERSFPDGLGQSGWIGAEPLVTIAALWRPDNRNAISQLRAYLDQNKWIDLARAATGHPEGHRFADVLEIARHGSKAGLVDFPLSSVHYMETLRMRSGRHRRDVGGVMNELSRQVTMVASTDVLPGEIDRAVRARWGRPTNLREVAIFGHGPWHAFREEPKRFHLSDDLQVDDETRARVEEHYTHLLEEALLSGPAEDFPYGGFDPQAGDALRERHAQDERDLGELIRRSNRKAGDFRAAWLARTLVELTPLVTESMLRAGLSPELFVGLGKDGLAEFLYDLPVASAVFEIRYRRHRDPALPWNRQDLNDLHALSMAVVHCDVVVTERHVAGLMKEAKLDQRHSTVVLTDLAELSMVLVSVVA